jgi:acyl-CoA synthetase (AMP-forming)/AMP-acid ligase II
MLGYWRRPEATREALRDGRYHTGDLGCFAEDGNLYVRGRRNDLILRGGANVYPAEVERVLEEHPGVARAAVLGVPDERLGERVVAVVQAAEGAGALAEGLLRAFCGERLARYKVPDRIALVAALPRNAMGKVRKRELRALFGADPS